MQLNCHPSHQFNKLCLEAWLIKKLQQNQMLVCLFCNHELSPKDKVQFNFIPSNIDNPDTIIEEPGQGIPLLDEKVRRWLQNNEAIRQRIAQSQEGNTERAVFALIFF